MKQHEDEGREDSREEGNSEDLQVISLLKRMQQQLAFLEKKVDTLIQQSNERQSFRQQSYSRPFRPFGGGHHRDHSQNRQGSGRPHGFRQNSKPFSSRRER